MSISSMLRFAILKLLRWKRKNFVPNYTQSGFDKQLNYSLWSTSRTRFAASKRLQRKHELSGRTIAFTSAYLILLSLLQIFSEETSLTQLLTYSSISLAIVILVVAQLENSSNYSLKAHKHHECGLLINSLYKKLRRLKHEYKDKEQDEKFWVEVNKYDDEYNNILTRFENHEDLDFSIFKANYPKYEDHRCNKLYVYKTKLHYYFHTQFFYHLLVYIPPVILAALLLHILGFYTFCFLIP
ncbi:SLATT domain-containing protein [Pseudoalteromonas fuliginea]|uniref:SLATT domain-containing protein n=1 Tax=Pseudoalteromonas fuliginea TaxID=1872678 RepID=A0ABQ6RIU7_9GAMM|nr:SLATT domain-containing protein [Pseudoalteromonas fuliginea]KAA1157586.1 SLATT domain-containing protein [Pseudoalteromonas fuliginea]KAA1167645.1 SLATT domain-containing protein [Pseudoalteromonas fuliginea]